MPSRSVRRARRPPLPTLDQSTADAQPQPRIEWVDHARGIGIILVVYGHALRAQVTSGYEDPRWQADWQDRFIYAFHMPLFFALAGLFAAPLVQRGLALFARDRAVTIVYPYLLWSTVTLVLNALAGARANYEVGLDPLPRILWEPVYQYWFLYVLLICSAFAFVIRGNQWAAIALAVFGLFDFGGWLPGMLGRSTVYFPYFFGALAAAGFVLNARVTRGRAFAMLAVGIVLLVLTLSWEPSLDTLIGKYGTNIVQAVSGVAAVIGLASLTAGHLPIMGLLGQASMAIFVLHTIFSAGLRIAMIQLGLAEPTLMLMCCALVGIVAPLVVWIVARRYGVSMLLGLGRAPKRAAA